MKKKSFYIYLIMTTLGMGILLLSLFLIKKDIGDALPYISVGIGCGIFGHGLGELIGIKNAKKHPDFAKEQEIIKNDERNIMLANKSKAKAFDIMIFVYGALMVSFGLMKIDTKVILLLVGAYLFICAVSIYFRTKYDKEM